jgi:hypothetical protein
VNISAIAVNHASTRDSYQEQEAHAPRCYLEVSPIEGGRGSTGIADLERDSVPDFPGLNLQDMTTISVRLEYAGRVTQQ